MEDSEARYRLPRSVVPSRYDLRLEPDLEAGRFSGTVEATVDVAEPVTEIVLNVNELHIGDATLIGADGARIEVSKILTDEEQERATLQLAETAEPGPWSLRIAFRGDLNPRLTGFYRSTYTHDGQTRVIGTTHFEATDARRAFPCWDEPDLKAVFGITLVVQAGLLAVSNGPEVERETLDDGRVRIRFADTIPMSTYLAAWVIGPLDATGPVDARGVPIRVVHVPGKGHLAPFALEASTHSLNWFADYYGIPYAERKLDNVAIPDFAQGAMENIGCITYREQVLLVDPDRSTREERIDVAETIAHEIAHMWFGDLVTMRWWNGIWLNEAFATFMSMLAIDAYRPDWGIWNDFIRGRTTALEVDALETTRPIEYEVRSPDDASGMFDTLTYVKGGAVLRMLEQWLGPERFRDGIRRYLRKHAYGNTETHDLWDALEEETGEPVRRIMDAWIFQPGYPAISVALEDGGRLRFSQRRFIPSKEDDDASWPVPLMVRQVADGEERLDRILIEAEGAELELLGPDAVVVANADSASFVRVWYDDELRARVVARALEVLSPIERYALVDDAWAAVVAGRASMGSFLDLVQGLRDESDLRVWQAILTGLGWVDRFVDGEPRERLRAFVRDLLRPAVERLGWEPAEDEPDLTRALRGQLIQSLAILGADPEALAQSRELELEGEGDPQLLQAAVEAVASEGTAEDLDRFWRRYRGAGTPQEEERYLFATSRFPGEAEIDRVLRASMSDEVRTQDAPYLLARATTNRRHGPRAWRFIADRWDEMQDRFASSNIIGLASGVRYLTDPSAIDEVDTFFRTHDIPQNHLMLQQILERMRVAAKLRERVTPELLERFGG